MPGPSLERFAAAIRRLLEHPHEARILAQRGREFAESLDWRAIARRHAELVEQCGRSQLRNAYPMN